MDVALLGEKVALKDPCWADDVPDAAIRLLEGGYDSPSLRHLAIVDATDSEVVEKLLLRTLEELGIPVPSPQEAGLATARRIANQVLQGSIAPYEGAKRIWDTVYTRFPELTVLEPFVGLASEYEDDEAHRDDYTRDIMEECRLLTA